MKQSLPDILESFIYLAGMSILGFIAGRIFPHGWLDESKFPFRSFSFEKNGKIYEKIGIRKWQNRIPDMSKVFPALMPTKKLDGNLAQKLPVMIKETCIAELTHVFLGIVGLVCPFQWKWPGVWLLTCFYVVGNVPFILVQRYNRPRQMHLLRSLHRKGTTNERKIPEKG